MCAALNDPLFWIFAILGCVPGAIVITAAIVLLKKGNHDQARTQVPDGDAGEQAASGRP